MWLFSSQGYKFFTVHLCVSPHLLPLFLQVLPQCQQFNQFSSASCFTNLCHLIAHRIQEHPCLPHEVIQQLPQLLLHCTSSIQSILMMFSLKLYWHQTLPCAGISITQTVSYNVFHVGLILLSSKFT